MFFKMEQKRFYYFYVYIKNNFKKKKKRVILVAQSIMDGGEWLSVDHLNPLVVIYGETLRLIVLLGLKVSLDTVYLVKNWKLKIL